MPRRPAAKTKKEPAVGSILQLKIRLLDVSPMIWRRVLVPVTYTLEELHGLIQVAMGWESIHLYRFRIHAVHYGSCDLCISSPRVALEHFRFRKGSKFTYEYDMGSGWRHEVRVEDGIEPQSGHTYPFCADGAHACPPWDCGGPAAYAERRLEAVGFDAMEDIGTLAELVQKVVLDGKTECLDEPDTRWRFEQALERVGARQPFLTTSFSRHTVNARLMQGEHRVLMHQRL